MKNPTELPRRVLAFGDQFGMFPQGGAILCALSGGVDSMALLTLLLELRELRDLRVSAAHYNHLLRGAESERDAAFVRDWCRRQGVPLTLGRGDVAAQAARSGRGIEDAARRLRYAFLEKTAQDQHALIATAHNAGDNAETVLLHLLRGSGLDGLAGISPRRGNLCRPLLEVPRQSLEAYLEAKGVPHVEDSSNADVTYRRNALRREVMPVLEAMGFSRRLAETLGHLRADRDFLDGLGRDLAQRGARTAEGIALPVQALREAPRPVAVRGVKAVLAELGRWEHSAAHLEAVLDLAQSVQPSGQLSLPQGLRVRREYDRLLFTTGEAEPPQSPPPLEIPGPGVYVWGGWTLRVSPAACPAAAERGWHFRDAVFPLLLRPRQTGDRLQLPRRREKTLKKWYIDEKIPRARRDRLPVLSDAQGVLAAAGLGPHAPRLAAPGEPAAYCILEQTKTERKEQQQ